MFELGILQIMVTIVQVILEVLLTYKKLLNDYWM